jgi:hypothetical protein
MHAAARHAERSTLTDEDVLSTCSTCSMMSDWKVELVEDNISEFYVEFGGPKDSECTVLKGVAALTSNHPVCSSWVGMACWCC